MDHFRGKPLDEMSREELISAVRELVEAYQREVAENVHLFRRLCQPKKSLLERVFWL